MGTMNDAGQELLIPLETALHRLVESFWEEPYRYFTEADAHVGLQTWVARRPELAQTYRTADGDGEADGFETSLLHREYPTSFRFSKRNPTERLPYPARRGYYDLVLIDPRYVESWPAATVSNQNINDRGDFPSPPLLAAVEFKLGTWSKNTVDGVRRDLGKLRLALGCELETPPDTGAAYLCVLQRYLSPGYGMWERDWPEVERMLAEYTDVGAVVAVCWPKQERDPYVHYSGPWITTTTT
jgi:hypothetical protein